MNQKIQYNINNSYNTLMYKNIEILYSEIMTKVSIDNLKEIISIDIVTPILFGKQIINKCYGFILNFMNNNYIISLHHNLPIETIYDNIININLSILINSGWSEVLILTQNNIISDYIIYKHYQNKLPKINSIVNIKGVYDNIIIRNDLYKIDIQLKIIEYQFVPFDNIQNDYLIPYIVAEFINNYDDILGLSGLPIFYEDKIIGIFSKYNKKTKTVFILPIYIVIKTLLKKDNLYIYTINNINNINKINSYKINNNYIYYPILKINIPLVTYILIEGDIDKYVVINNNIKEPIYYYQNNELVISNEPILITQTNNTKIYKVNVRLLTLLLKINKIVVLQLFEKINKYNSLLWIKINENNKINIIN